MAKSRRHVRRKLNVSATLPAESAKYIPTWWLNTVIGVFLLIPVFLLNRALFSSFSHVATAYQFWASEEFWFFSLGAVLWVLAFFGSIWACGEPRPLRVYVFGHELTHAIWVWVMGGRVSDFEFGRSGGFILTNKHNVWIALAPYFYPVYSVAVAVLYGVASVFYDLSSFTPVLFGLIGLTWAFHLSFTVWMIPKGQSDLTQFGTFYSLVIIYGMNLLLLTGLLIIAAPEATFSVFAGALLEAAEDFAAFAVQVVLHMRAWF
jgi:hypothetical protein